MLEKKLLHILGDDYLVIQTISKSLNVNSDNIKLKMKLRVLDEELTKKLLDNWDSYAEKLEYQNLSLEEKEACLKLF